MPPSDLQQAVLAHVRRSNYQPVKPKVIAKQLGLNQEGARDLKRVIKKLVKRGQLAYGENHLVMATRSDEPIAEPAAEAKKQDRGPLAANQATGVFRRMAAGYGFVVLSAARPQNEPKQDVYISAKNTADASSGDVVLIEINKHHRPGKPGPDGKIIEVLDRETNRFVGTYFESGGLGRVQVDGKLFSQPISVGDPGAKGACPDDKVVLEMVRFPSHAHDGEGVLVEILGPQGAPGVDTLSIIHEFNLPGDFSEDVLETARDVAEAFDASIGSDRTDFTADTVITIDPEDARDFDDAISLERIEKNHWRLGVHIADVSHFVQPKTPLDREARDRATSVYLPDRVIPMLPEVISNNLASLQPDRVRYALTAILEMTPEGTLIGCEVVKSAIKSKRRFTYEEVDSYLSKPSAWKKKLSPEVHALLGNMHELAMILRRRRFERGALELNMPEVKVELDRHGRVTGAGLVENTESHQIIEEFMLAANIAVAERLRDAHLMFMRRIHQSPDPRKLKALAEFVRDLGFPVESLESRTAIQELLDAVVGLPQQHAVHFAVLRSLQKAVYSPIEEGHYALASECYCHFTSPIRRYPDLTIHRLYAALLAGEKPSQEPGELLAQSEHCSHREQRAEKAERELKKVKLLNYFSERIGEEMDGIITGVTEYGLFIEGVPIPAEGFVHVSALSDDYYRYDKTTHTLTGHRRDNVFRLGDAVRIAVVRVDVALRELDFRLLGRLARPATTPKRSAKPRPSSTKSRPAKRAKGTKKTSGKKKAPRKKKKPGKKKSGLTKQRPK